MGGGGDWNPFKGSFWERGGIAGAAINSLGDVLNPGAKQVKVANNAALDAAKVQNKLIKDAEDKAASEESTGQSAISRARMKALAAAAAATGRSSTIKTGQQGVIGSAPGTAKSLIGE